MKAYGMPVISFIRAQKMQCAAQQLIHTERSVDDIADAAELDVYHASNLMRIARRLCDELGKMVILVLNEINYAAFYSDYICAFKIDMAALDIIDGGAAEGRRCPHGRTKLLLRSWADTA